MSITTEEKINTKKDYLIDVSNVPKEYTGQYSVEGINGEKIISFSHEFLRKIKENGFNMRVISILEGGYQDNKGNINEDKGIVNIGVVKGITPFVTNKAIENIRVIPKK